jgi:hypothetical protein
MNTDKYPNVLKFKFEEYRPAALTCLCHAYRGSALDLRG